MTPADRRELRSDLLDSARDGQLPPRVADLLVAAADYLVGRASDEDFIAAIQNLDVEARGYVAKTATRRLDVPDERSARWWNELAAIAAAGGGDLEADPGSRGA